MAQRVWRAFADLLRQHRVSAGLTQEALADRAGLTARAIGYLEHGSRLPNPTTIRLLSVALGLTAAAQADLAAAARPSVLALPSIRDARSSDHAVARCARQPGGTHRVGVPLPLTPLLGREDAMATVEALLRGSSVRLLTLTGTGGVGKTRLALEVATRLGADYGDGVYFVPLATIREPSAVLPTIAAALGIHDTGERPLQRRVREWLSPRHVLLVLDNFEQVGTAAPEVAALLATSPALKVLVTSRAPLRLRAEQEYLVTPLSLPTPEEEIAVDTLERSPAVALFVARARAVCHDFALTQENAATVAAICHRLDGLPLALELAAARVKIVSPATLLVRLEHRLQVLTGGAVDLPERQQTLRATLDWSHSLLAPEEQILFRRLAVFHGGSTIDAVSAVCTEDTVTAEMVLDVLSALVDKSMVVAGNARDEVRHAMLETVRAYALERLAESGEEDRIRARHLVWCRELAETAERGLRGPHQRAWLDRLEDEVATLREAVAWAGHRTPVPGEQDAPAEDLLRMATALWYFWDARGSLVEGIEWLQVALDRCDQVSPGRAGALACLGHMVLRHGTEERAERLFAQSLDLARASSDCAALASALYGLWWVRSSRDPTGAARLLDEAEGFWRELGDRWRLAHARHEQAWRACIRGDSDTAHRLFGEALSLMRELGDARGSAQVLLHRARLLYDADDLARATSLVAESLALAREVGDRLGMARALADLAHYALLQDQWEGARDLCEESLVLFRQVQSDAWVAYGLWVIGTIAAHVGDYARGASLLGESSALHRALGDRGAPRYLLGLTIGDRATATYLLGLQAWAESCAGRYAVAVRLGEQCLSELETIGDPHWITWGHMAFGTVLRAAGRLERAREHALESMSQCHSMLEGSVRTLTVCFNLYNAGLLAAASDLSRSVRLLSACEVLRQGSKPLLALCERAARDAVLARALDALGWEPFDLAWAEGAALCLDAAIAYGLESLREQVYARI